MNQDQEIKATEYVQITTEEHRRLRDVELAATYLIAISENFDPSRWADSMPIALQQLRNALRSEQNAEFSAWLAQIKVMQITQAKAEEIIQRIRARVRG